jgi:transposase
VEITPIGIDVAKDVFAIHGVDAQGRVRVRKRLVRKHLLEFLSQLPACLVGMEACASAHYWAREIAKHGHEVRLINPRFVRPYVKANKNDATDAEAICEAAGRPAMRFVAVKTAAQQDVQAVHRVRQQLVKSHTALMNQVRGLLAEQGIVIPQGSAHLHRSLPRILADDDNRLSGVMRELLSEIGERLNYLEDRLRQYELRIQRLFREDERCRRLTEVEGVGPLTATALVAAVGNAAEFKSGRELAAYLGLVPRHRASGGRTTMLGISKRIVICAPFWCMDPRPAVYTSQRRRDAQSIWVSRLKLRRGANVAAVALANKNARVMWKLLSSGGRFRAQPLHPDRGARPARAPLGQGTGRRGA